MPTAHSVSSVSDLRFDGRVAIITGAGGQPSLGRAYAHLLASRGAKVLVNDLGTGVRDNFPADARSVVDEIVNEGGQAVADTHSVDKEETATTVVETALDSWGRVDILINNAGGAVLGDFVHLAPEHIRRMIDVNLYGSIWMCRAVWSTMASAGYGRILNVTSDAMLGGSCHSVYSAAKAGVFGLTMSLAIEGSQNGIAVNVVGPRAISAAAREILTQQEVERKQSLARPEHVAPVVAYLVSDRSTVTGRYFEVHAGRVRERFMSQSKGYVNPALTIEDVRDNIGCILDRTTAMALPLEPRYAPEARQRYDQHAIERYSQASHTSADAIETPHEHQVEEGSSGQADGGV